MLLFKKKYFFIIESIKDINLRNIKKRNKFAIIYRNSKKNENNLDLFKFRMLCKSKDIKFFIANNLSQAVRLKCDGVYLSAKNKNFRYLNFHKKNFYTIGGAHNIKEINLKKKQGCKYIFLSRLFKVSYKPSMSFLGVNKFNNYILKSSIKTIPLGGINGFNLNKLKLVRSDGLAILTEIKKKPANIINRLF